MDKNLFNNIKDKKDDTNEKLDKMRTILYDEEKCKEIAQKLCAYIKGS